MVNKIKIWLAKCPNRKELTIKNKQHHTNKIIKFPTEFVARLWIQRKIGTNRESHYQWIGKYWKSHCQRQRWKWPRSWPREYCDKFLKLKFRAESTKNEIWAFSKRFSSTIFIFSILFMMKQYKIKNKISGRNYRYL